MKVFFDTNVYVAEALLGGAAERIVAATLEARWRIFSSDYVLDETERVLGEKLASPCNARCSQSVSASCSTRSRRQSDTRRGTRCGSRPARNKRWTLADAESLRKRRNHIHVGVF